MSDPMKQAWDEVTEHFTALGRMMKERYAGDAGDAPTAAAASEAVAGGAKDASAALHDAFDKLVAAGREFGDRAADVARDDDVKAEAKRAAASLNDALSATVDLIGEQVGGLFKRSKAGDP